MSDMMGVFWRLFLVRIVVCSHNVCCARVIHTILRIRCDQYALFGDITVLRVL